MCCSWMILHIQVNKNCSHLVKTPYLHSRERVVPVSLLLLSSSNSLDSNHLPYNPNLQKGPQKKHLLKSLSVVTPHISSSKIHKGKTRAGKEDHHPRKTTVPDPHTSTSNRNTQINLTNDYWSTANRSTINKLHPKPISLAKCIDNTNTRGYSMELFEHQLAEKERIAKFWASYNAPNGKSHTTTAGISVFFIHLFVSLLPCFMLQPKTFWVIWHDALNHTSNRPSQHSSSENHIQ